MGLVLSICHILKQLFRQVSVNCACVGPPVLFEALRVGVLGRLAGVDSPGSELPHFFLK